MRCGVLVVLLSGLAAAVATKVFTRLFREFRDDALALVLERRFPRILGDRLITAVELADPKKAAAIGYSAAMVQETIHEAAQRVEQLQIKEVFDWGRLKRRGILVAVLALGGYLLVGAGFCGVNALQGHGVSAAGFGQFHEVAGIWFERNILLQNVIWPRMAHLEMLDVPESGEWKMGRGDKPPTIRVRALKYVIAGAPTRQAVNAYRDWLDSRKISGDDQEALVSQFSQKPSEGWRALSWFDLTPELLGESVPTFALPDWKVRNLAAGLTIDEIELNLDKTETHKTLDADAAVGMRNVLERIDERAVDPALSRILRRLEVPEEVVLIYKGNTTSSQTTMQKLADNEYTGQFGDLKETVTFTVQGLDYYTATRSVIVVDPPALDNLMREEERPAYLYYRLKRGDDPEILSGKKQRFEETKVSLQGGEVSRIDVPVGTNLVLTATASKDLQEKGVVIEAHKSHKSSIPLTHTPVEMLDARTFRTSFQNVRFEQNFVFRFTDTDGVTGQRQVVIIPSEDAPPKIRELAPDDIVRKVAGGYMVAVGARIPFKGQVDDDHGLTDVRYAYTIAVDTGKSDKRDDWPRLVAWAIEVTKTVLPEKKAEDLTVQYYVLPRFTKVLKDRPDDNILHVDTIREELAKKQKEPYRSLLRTFRIQADEWSNPELDPVACDLPLSRTNSNLKVSDPLKSQPHYKMELWLEAIDTDLDSEKDKNGKPKPHLKVSEEKFTFLLVSENALLAEIAKEEEKLYTELDSTYQRLRETEGKLRQANIDLTSASLKVADLGPISARADQISDTIDKSQNTTRTVYEAYARILKEMKTNQVDNKWIVNVEKNIVDPLKKVDRTFDDTRDSLTAMRKVLDGKDLAPDPRIEGSRKAADTAKKQMDLLLVKIEAILASMRKLAGINDLIKILVVLDKDETEQYELIKKINDALEDDLFGQISGDKKPEKK
jgi:hypothetical protein